MKSIVLATAGLIALSVAAPASAVKMVFQVKGFADLEGVGGSAYDWTPFDFRYIYLSEEIVISVDGFHCPDPDSACNSDPAYFYYGAPLRYATGRMGETVIPFHAVTGGVSAGGYDPVGIGVGPNSGLHPIVGGGIVDYGAGSLYSEQVHFYNADSQTSNWEAQYPDGNYYFARITGISIAAAVPEPSAWVTMLVGFGVVGFAARRKRSRIAVSYS